MDILFRSKKLQKSLENDRERVKTYGADRGKKLKQRLDDLRAAPCLNDISRLPPARCHELGLNRKGQLSVDIGHPFRLVFIVANDPIPLKVDGGLDWHAVTAVEVLEVEDTHPNK